MADRDTTALVIAPLHAQIPDDVMALCRRLLPAARRRWAIVAGLLFVLHPITAETVDNASFREDSLVTVFTLATLILATSSQWALITRQAMTDMPFVSPMTIALCFAGLALIGPEEEREAELPRGQFLVGRLKISWPRSKAFGGTVNVACPAPSVQMSGWRPV